MPKSVTFARPSLVRSTFCGFTSRWTSPCWCAKASARPISSPSSRRRRAGSGPARSTSVLQGLAVDVLEDDELAPVRLAAVDDGDDVRVRELRRGARLVPEALDVVVVLGVVLVQDLQRDVPLEQRVVRAVDARHAARADDVLELVAVRDQLAHRHRNLAFPQSAEKLVERRLERVFPDVERLVELGVGDHERAEHADAVAVHAGLEQQQPALQRRPR